MRFAPRRGTARRAVASMAAIVVAVGLLALPGGATTAQPEDSAAAEAAAGIAGGKALAQSSDVYIVRFAGDPAVAFEGDADRGLARTAPEAGAKLNSDSAAVQSYTSTLERTHATALAAAGAAPDDRLYSYTYALNGMAARLTSAEAARLRARDDVLSVTEQFWAKPTTDNSHRFLGLSGRGGLWRQLGGRAQSGAGTVVGVIDSGVWPENASFSDRRNPNRGPRFRRGGRVVRNPVVMPEPPAYWQGRCEHGEDDTFDSADCNNKLIGARYFNQAYYRVGTPEEVPIGDRADYQSPRDHDGHGSHTAGTAAGRESVSAPVFGTDHGPIHGMAPRAHVAVYKACWEGISCAGADLVAAIDTAVADGVDVINYSIGSAAPTILSADTISFLFAADAGVFVATSNGNAGPGASSVGSPATVPWVTSVGASTQDRDFQGRVRLGNGQVFRGVTITRGAERTRILDAEDFENPLCLVDEFERPRRLADRIVLCARGVNGRAEKSLAVQEVGGAGMVLHNVLPGDSLNTDNHYVPSLHVRPLYGRRIKQYIAEPGPSRAELTGGRKVASDGNTMALFSSRGPNGGAPDIVKPDVTAPGVNILAAGTPTPFRGLGVAGQGFQAISGTSMSSPHVAGIAALLRQRRPGWTPDMIKSALMTSARQNVAKENGRTPADPFDFGAGHVDPVPAADPGLVYKVGTDDYFEFLQGNGNAELELDGIDPSDLNLASIGIGDLAGRQTVTRTVTSVSGQGRWRAEVDAPAGVEVDVSPARLDLRGGQSASYEVAFETIADQVVYDQFTHGAITWVNADTGAEVRSPLSVRPVVIAAPDEITGTGAAGSETYEVQFGYDGEFLAAPRGLVPPTTFDDTVVDDPNNLFVSLDQVGVSTHEVEVTDNTEYARFSLFNEEVEGNGTDLDLYVFDEDLNLVGASGSATSDEQVDLDAPTPGTYTVAVHGWNALPGGPDGADYRLYSWQVGSDAAGNMTVASSTDTATRGETADITVTWDGLTAGRWMGAVTYHDSAAAVGYRDDFIGATLVRVDVGGGESG